MKTEEDILKCFSDRGMRIELGAQFSARGQVAQLIDGTRDALLELNQLEDMAHDFSMLRNSVGLLLTINRNTKQESRNDDLENIKKAMEDILDKYDVLG